MTPNSDWWDRAKLPPRSQPIEVRKRERLYTLHRDAHEITLEKATGVCRRGVNPLCQRGVATHARVQVTRATT
jgi:hypothetical protein